MYTDYGIVQDAIIKSFHNTADEIEKYDNFVRQNYINMLLSEIDTLKERISILEENLEQQTYNKTNNSNT